jgi:hypothetical protein
MSGLGVRQSKPFMIGNRSMSNNYQRLGNRLYPITYATHNHILSNSENIRNNQGLTPYEPIGLSNQGLRKSRK